MAEPGFKEVKGGRISFGSIPEDWEVDKLINVCLEKPEYGAGESAIEYTEGMVRYVRITDIKEDGILKDEKAGITDEAAEQYLLSEGDFLFARSGSVGRTYRYEKKDGSCAFAGYLIRFKTDLSKIRIEYLKGYCQSHMYRCWVNYISRVTSQPNINAKEYSSLPIPLPSLSEQDRILRFLSRVDSGIEKAGRLITEHRELKRGMMQKLFTEGIGHTEFKDTKIGRIPVAWEISRLGKLGIFFKGKTIAKKEIVETGLPCIRYGDIYVQYKHSNIVTHFSAYISQETARNGRKLSKGDIIFAGTGETQKDIGKCVAYTMDDEAYAGGDLVVFRQNSSELFDPVFLSSGLNNGEVMRLKSRLGQGLSIFHIYSDQLRTLFMPVPPIMEQRRIASILSNIDARIEKELALKTELQELKRGLMQVLLTGKVRVNA